MFLHYPPFKLNSLSVSREKSKFFKTYIQIDWYWIRFFFLKHLVKLFIIGYVNCITPFHRYLYIFRTDSGLKQMKWFMTDLGMSSNWMRYLNLKKEIQSNALKRSKIEWHKLNSNFQFTVSTNFQFIFVYVLVFFSFKYISVSISLIFTFLFSFIFVHKINFAQKNVMISIWIILWMWFKRFFLMRDTVEWDQLEMIERICCLTL